MNTVIQTLEANKTLIEKAIKSSKSKNILVLGPNAGFEELIYLTKSFPEHTILSYAAAWVLNRDISQSFPKVKPLFTGQPFTKETTDYLREKSYALVIDNAATNCGEQQEWFKDLYEKTDAYIMLRLNMGLNHNLIPRPYKSTFDPSDKTTPIKILGHTEYVNFYEEMSEWKIENPDKKTPGYAIFLKGTQEEEPVKEKIELIEDSPIEPIEEKSVEPIEEKPTPEPLKEEPKPKPKPKVVPKKTSLKPLPKKS